MTAARGLDHEYRSPDAQLKTHSISPRRQKSLSSPRRFLMALKCSFVFAREASCHSDIRMSEGFFDVGRGHPALLRSITWHTSGFRT